MVQYGFFFDQSRCVGCHSCAIICKVWNQLPPGPAKYMRVYEWETGIWPTTRLHFLAINCYHCENSVCAEACPVGAIHKEEKYGAVIINPDICVPSVVNCNRACWERCPYGSIVFASDNSAEKAQKCTMCIDRLEQGKKPICVEACSLRALDFGPMEEIKKKYGTLQQLPEMPSPDEVKPAVIFKPADPPRQVVRYDVEKAIKLWQQRGPYAAPGLPPVFADVNDVKKLEGVRTGPNKLVLKPKNAQEFMYYTTNHE